MFAGKKTYLAALAAVLGAVSAALSGQMTWPQAIELIVPAILAACIRNGVTTENAKVAAAAAPPKPVPTDAEKQTLAKFGVVVPLILAATMLAGCATGAGRAVSVAFSGTPPEVGASLDEIEKRLDAKSAYVLADVLAAAPTTPAGLERKRQTQADLETEHAQLGALFSDLRDYLGLTKGSPEASRAAALKRWNDALAAAMKRITPPALPSGGGGQ